MAASEDRNRLDSREQAQDSELEQYGVWVKAGPEDVDESEAEDEAFTLTDLGEDELDDAEMDLLGGEGERDFSASDVDLSESVTSLDDLGDSISIDEDELTEADDLDEIFLSEDAADTTEGRNDTPEEHDLLTLEEDDITLEMDEEAEELGLDDSVDLTEEEPIAAEPLDLDLDDAEEAEEASPADDEVEELSLDELDELDDDDESGSGGIDIEDELPGDLDDLTLDLDSLDVDSFGEPTEGTAHEHDAEHATPAADEEEETALEDELDLDLSDAGDSLNLDASELNLEEDELDIESLGLDDDTEVAELDLSSLPGDDEDFAPMSGESDALSLDSEPEDDLPELEADDDLALGAGFDDLGAVEDEMTAPSQPAEPAASKAAPAGESAESTSLLASIERELASIRSELSDLKNQLSHLRARPASPAVQAPEASADDEAAGGFFEDESDEDETIALTGAELDNIMSTAEFTEEAGKPTDLEDFGGMQPEGELDLDRIGSDDQPAVQEITLDDAPEDLGTIDLDLDAEQSQDESEDSARADDEIFAGTEEDVEALAGMDIDAELADINELEDESPDMAPLEFDESAADEDLILDAEPLDEASIEEEPEIQAIDVDMDDTQLSGADEPLVEDEPRLEIGGDLSDLASIGDSPIPENLKGELRSVLNYMDKLLDSLPEEKIQEFAASDHFKVYKRLFEELGLEQ